MRKKILLQSNLDFPEMFEESSAILMFSKKSPFKETVNEDAVAVFNLRDKFVIAIADGAGGHPKGEEAAALVLNTLDLFLKKATPTDSSFRSLIVDAIEDTNKKLLELGNGARTTVTVCEVSNNKARGYQVGDSTMVVCGQKGKLKFRSTSHSPVGYGIEAGLIDEKEALEHPDLHYISNLVGSSDMKIEIGPEVELNANDSIFLASDGIFDNFAPEEIVELIRTGTLEENSLALMDLVTLGIYEKDETKKDDISFILFKC